MTACRKFQHISIFERHLGKMGSVNKFTFFKEVIRDTSLTESARLIAIAIANYSDAQGLNSRPGNKKLFTELGMSESTVTRGVRSLISRGWIERVSEGDGRGYAAVYNLKMPVDKLVNNSVDNSIKGVTSDDLSRKKVVTSDGKRVSPVTTHQINDHINARETKGSSGDPLLNSASKRAEQWRAVCARRGLSPDYQTTSAVLANWPNDEMRQPSYLAEKISEIEEIENVAGGGAVVYQFPKSN